MISNIALMENSKIIDQLLEYNILDELLKLIGSEDQVILEQMLLAIRCILKKGSLITKRMILDKFEKFESIIKLQELCNHPIGKIRDYAALIFFFYIF